MAWAQTASGDPQYAVQLIGFSHHFDSPESPNRKWNEFNPGLGIERTTAMDGSFQGWRQRMMGGTLRDSLGEWGLYTGVVWQKRLLQGNVEVDAGGGAFLLWRALKFDGPRKLFPAPMPVVSVRHVPSGIGVNFTAMPRFTTSQGTHHGYVFAQGTVNF
jgi:hypothetical protein